MRIERKIFSPVFFIIYPGKLFFFGHKNVWLWPIQIDRSNNCTKIDWADICHASMVNKNFVAIKFNSGKKI